MKSAAIAEDRHARRIATPEGVTLSFEVAGAAERILAFAIDALLVHGLVAAFVVAGVLAVLPSGSDLPLAFALVASFLLRNFYFVWAEMRWAGQTLGKRRLGLRVIARDGGPLTAEAIFARNLTRDLEIFLPLTALLRPEQIVPGAPGWGALAGAGWLFLFALLPLFSRDRLRCGDLVAGTIVVRAPKAPLLEDLAEAEPVAPWAPEPAAGRYRFTPAQLDVYGEHELHVLERVLRARPGGRQDVVLRRVAAAIQRKIGWPSGQREADPREFLLDFYRAQRGRLEHGLLLGRRRERKRG